MPYIKFLLQLFGEEEGTSVDTGDSGTGDADTTATETPEAPAEGEQAAPATADQGGKESWDSLVKGKYKKEYGNAVHNAVAKRLKNQQDLQGRLGAIDPIVQAMSQKYGIQANPDGTVPIDKLQQAIDADNSLYEDEAYKRGISVDELKHIKSLERENAQLKQAEQSTQNRMIIDDLQRQGEALKEMYPDFDLKTELDNADFGRLLSVLQKSGAADAVRTAYEVTHRDEIMSGGMAYAVQRTKEKVSKSIQSGLKRPAENGTTGQATSQIGEVDPSKLTSAQLKDYISRAERGEKITFAP